ncbi:uncharacterized protein LODBEIA_P44480 [Lodderomyces beijingensis]|uniref:1-phosphatidylinositol-3-phosphate 5-kinase n=1 Tax=Lodderomyces beijingensis TaxID=1775926 RepID=A0ABP0ZQ09_9ASCO
MRNPSSDATQVEPASPSNELSRRPSNSNNSDEETQDSAKVKEDFVSFPTIADPEDTDEKSFSGLISKTLRKVTTNATKLVENYSGHFDYPKPPNNEAANNNNSHSPREAARPAGRTDSADVASISRDSTHVKANSILSSKASVSNFNNPILADLIDVDSVLPKHISTEGMNLLPPAPSEVNKLDNSNVRTAQMVDSSTRSVNNKERPEKHFPAQESQLRPLLQDPMVSRSPQITSSSAAAAGGAGAGAGATGAGATGATGATAGKNSRPSLLATDLSSGSVNVNKLRKVASNSSGPKVTSDSKSLRLSTLQFPRAHHSINPSATNSMVNVNAQASSTDLTAGTSSSKRLQSEKDRIHSSSNAKENSLKKKMSTIFNNLPNDIELSDDSASDSDTTESTHHERIENSLSQPFSKKITLAEAGAAAAAIPSSPRTSVHQLQFDLGSRYSDSIAKSSPIKAESKTKATFTTHFGDSPTISSFQALQSKDHNKSKKRSSTFSSILLDNAKTIINQNIGAVASSASSIVGKKKKKYKPKKISENPLKNGGIPKKYWMDDAFVSDCLNCFKPFTAFRRKHHCRFCGHIFCSDCMLFISYTQHKEERNNIIEKRRPYNDKLRVCKPCYSDVIIYLSDESSGSEADDDSDVVNEEYQGSSEIQKGTDLLVPNHPLSRIRSLSTNSVRGSLHGGDSGNTTQSSDHRNDAGSSRASNSPSRSNSQFIYPDESIKSNPKQAPRMAIPTTRAGESVEIPLVRHSLSSMNIFRNTTKTHGGSFKQQLESFPSKNNLQAPHLNQLTANPVHHSHHHHNHQNHNHHNLLHHNHNHNQTSYPSRQNQPSQFFSHTPFGATSTNQARLSSSGANSSDAPVSRSYENPGVAYNNFVSRKPSLKSRLQSESKKLESFESSDEETSRVFMESESFDSDSEEELDHRLRKTYSEEEDEHAMSLYASLNDSQKYGSTPHAANSSHIFGSSSSSVPTLREFPLIKTFFGEGVNQLYADIANSTNVNFAESQRHPESVRSRARANASLQRMRSRRKSKPAKSGSALTNNTRLQSLESPSPRHHNSNHQNQSQQNQNQQNQQNQSQSQNQSQQQQQFSSYLSPISSPTSPKLENSNRSNLTSAITSADIHSDAVSNSSNPNCSEMLSLGPRVSTSTMLGSKNNNNNANNNTDYFAYDQDDSPVRQDTTDHVLDQKSVEVGHQSALLYENYLAKVLRQTLQDCNITADFGLWMATLVEVLKSVDSIELTDTLDIKQYVKIKRICGGKIEQTNIVDGLFMTKNVDTKRMANTIDNPRIALLMFPIEYLKQREQFISLRIIQAQQEVYITNLVSRLISLEPDIIVVGDSVCGLAEKLLEEAGITVLSNVKPQVIERISRYSQADIFQSVNDLFFKKGNLGKCTKFEVRRFRYKGTVKSFTFFSGTPLSHGFTICLRGGNDEVLSGVKFAAETLTPGYFNARFERSFFDNMLLTFDASNDSDGSNGSKKSEEINNLINDLQSSELWQSIEPKLEDEIIAYIDALGKRMLSLSPCVEFSLPVPLTNLIRSYHEFYDAFAINQTVQALSSSEVDNAHDILGKLNALHVLEFELPGKNVDLVRILKCMSDHRLKLSLSELHLRARIWANSLKYTSYQLLPLFHRSIYLLHSTVSIKHATPCAGPNIVVVDYYTENDKSLGSFLDQAFKDSSITCGECQEKLLDHYKTYVHGNAKLDLIMEKYDIHLNDESGNFQGKNQRVMWSYCKECNYVTPIMAMSAETYYLSIGKFFELNFHGENVKGHCGHDFFQNYVKCFGFNELLIRMEYSKIDNYEIVVPKKQLQFIADIDIKLKLDSYKSIRSRAQRFFDSISKRLNRVKLDTFVKAEDGTKKIKELKEKLASDVQIIYSKLNQKYEEINAKSYLELNGIFRDLQKLGILWDNEFNEFEKNYLPNESEVNRITQFHLRKFLMDKYDKQPAESSSEAATGVDQSNENDDNVPAEREKEIEIEQEKQEEQASQPLDNEEDELKEKSPRKQMPQSKSAPHIQTVTKPVDDEAVKSNKEDADLLKPLPEITSRRPLEWQEDRRRSDPNIEFKMFSAPSPIRKQSSNISERISKWEQTASENTNPNTNTNTNMNMNMNLNSSPLAEQKHTLSHRGSDSSLPSINNVIIPSQNKVTHLANFFDKMYYDQISLEFSKQREFEMKKRSRIKAQPIMDSKPIVEIYNKIEDVVGGLGPYDKKKIVELESKQDDRKKKNLEPESKKPGDSRKNSGQEPKKDESGLEVSALKQDDSESVESSSQQVTKQVDTPEKQSLLKSLTNFWADRSATLWDPLAYPLDRHEHTFADSDVIVREDEPSSLVAFCLSSNDYKQKMKNVFEARTPAAATNATTNATTTAAATAAAAAATATATAPTITTTSASANGSVYDPRDEEASKKATNVGVGQGQQLNNDDVAQRKVDEIKSKVEDVDNKLNHIIEEQQNEEDSGVELSDGQADNNKGKENEYSSDQGNKVNDFGFGLNSSLNKKYAQFAKIEKKFKQKNPQVSNKESPLETVLNQKKTNHLKYQFSDGNTNLSCKIFYSEQFHALRKACGVQDSFVQSLSRCIKWQSSGGKSGSSFLKTLDNRYIVKELSKSELESFVSIAPFYFKYMGQSMFYTLTTAIAKIFGFYQVEVKNSTTGKLFKMDFLIMENLFYNHKTTRIFDLKGSMRNRHVQQTGKENEVLLDENMIEYIYESPVFVKEHSKKLLRGCLFNDTSFLSAMDVMDYSLVIGIDDTSKKLYIGIIDWLRAFTWDKKVENWVKGSNLMIGGGKKGKDPTIVTPKQYRIRFREAMERYILEVPDIWYEGRK